VPGDTLFAISAVVLVAFVFFGRSASEQKTVIPDAVRVPSGD
jgi:hypothetical protein